MSKERTFDEKFRDITQRFNDWCYKYECHGSSPLSLIDELCQIMNELNELLLVAREIQKKMSSECFDASRLYNEISLKFIQIQKEEQGVPEYLCVEVDKALEKMNMIEVTYGTSKRNTREIEDMIMRLKTNEEYLVYELNQVQHTSQGASAISID